MDRVTLPLHSIDARKYRDRVVVQKPRSTDQLDHTNPDPTRLVPIRGGPVASAQVAYLTVVDPTVTPAHKFHFGGFTIRGGAPALMSGGPIDVTVKSARFVAGVSSWAGPGLTATYELTSAAGSTAAPSRSTTSSATPRTSGRPPAARPS